MKPTLLVTGSAGFIGSNFVDTVIETTSWNVVSLDALTYAGNPESLAGLPADRHQLVRGDIADPELVARLLGEHQPEAVVNFAAESHVDRSIIGPQAFLQTNVHGTYELLQAVRAWWERLPEGRRSSFRFLHVSTDEVYGTLGPDDPPFREDTPYAPNSPYAASKAASDHLVRAWHHTYGLPVLTTNCSNNYGPRQFPEKLIPLVLLNALAGEPLPVYGDGRQVRDWLHVQDHCEAILRVLQKGRLGETYNIGGNCEKPNIEVVHTICDVLDRLRPDQAGPRRRLITHVTDRPGHDRRYAIDTGKISAELGWQPRFTFAGGILQTIEWYLANSAWIESVRSGSYRDWIEANYGHRSTTSSPQ